MLTDDDEAGCTDDERRKEAGRYICRSVFPSLDARTLACAYCRRVEVMIEAASGYSVYSFFVGRSLVGGVRARKATSPSCEGGTNEHREACGDLACGRTEQSSLEGGREGALREVVYIIIENVSVSVGPRSSLYLYSG